MLRKHSQLLLSGLFISDMLVLSASWLLAYWIRFNWDLIPIERGVPPLEPYLRILPYAVVVWALVFKALGLYLPRRGASLIYEFRDLLKASTFSTMILILITFFVRDYSYSRVVMVYFWFLNVLLLWVSRSALRELLRLLRRRGYNLRHALIVGGGETGRRVAERIGENAWAGLRARGFLSDDHQVGEAVAGLPVLGPVSGLKEAVRQYDVDQVFVALPLREHEKMAQILDDMADETADIRIVPDLYEYVTLNASVDDFDGIPIVSLSESPLYGWNRILKRIADIGVSSVLLVAAGPLMGFIALLVKLTSPGPVFYRQERISLGGEAFTMLKFRTMREDAEAGTGPKWADPDDPRRTRMGAFLRRMSLDELPQFWNVLKGEMSIVGPRPERPVFIDEFRKTVPRYMLRHKMKAGITGWAQVNGWRGNTSLEKRIEYDLYYIENWSLAFDLKIMWLTLWKGLINRNAY